MADRPGPKAGEKSPKDLACDIARQILDDEKKRPKLGYGRRITLARMVNDELARLGYRYANDSVRKMIGLSLEEWEAKNPQK
jgi:hypothetical protein